jgi:DNA-binding NarL/FixJ family response regulator
MQAGKRVIMLCGTSVFVAGLEVCLRQRPEISIVSAPSPLEALRDPLRDWHPDAVIFDWSEFSADVVPRLAHCLSAWPSMLIIALDLTSSDITVVRSEQHTARTPQDLLDAISAGIQGATGDIGLCITGLPESAPIEGIAGNQ